MLSIRVVGRLARADWHRTRMAMCWQQQQQQGNINIFPNRKPWRRRHLRHEESKAMKSSTSASVLNCWQRNGAPSAAVYSRASEFSLALRGFGRKMLLSFRHHRSCTKRSQDKSDNRATTDNKGAVCVFRCKTRMLREL